MRKVVDDSLVYTYWDKVDKLTFELITNVFLDLCYGNCQPNEMRVSEKTFDHLNKDIFKDYPEVKEHMKFCGANIIIADLPLFQIEFQTTKVPERFMNSLNKINGVICGIV